jgi:tubby-related protein 1
MSLVNNPPSWNEEVRAFVLNFNGRVTMASIKNFQMVEESNPDEILLQFGRTGKDTFSLDVQWPLSPFQAFSLALSSFDSKLGCD